jgi:type I restriction enzyme S subunit
VKWISARDITPNHKGFITETEKTITALGLEKSSTKILPKYSMVISARGTVGKYCILSESMAFSQSNYGIKPKIKDCYFFTYLLIAYSVDELQAAAYGSVFDTITTNTFKEHKLNIPPDSEIQSFEQSVKPYFEKILRNNNQICTLTRLRDTLLPKLMSGEVRVEYENN